MPFDVGRRELAAMATGSASDDERPRRWSSRQLHRLGDAAAHAWAGVAVLGVAVAWVGVGAVVGFPVWWLDLLYATSSVVAVVMLFALQHLQARDQMAVQRKLDEILRSLPGADVTLVAVEDASDETLRALTRLDQIDRSAAP